MAKNRKILILGGTGFIGSAVVCALADDKSCRVSAIHHEPLRDTEPSEALYYHLDAATGPEALRSLLVGHDTLVILTQPNERVIKNVLSVTPKGVRVLYASSVLVYKEDATPRKEDASLHAVSDYERGKLAEEKLLRSFAEKSGANPVTIMRFGSVYGGPKNQGIVSLFLRALQSGEPVTIAGDGTHVRDFIHVDDVVAAMRALIGREQKELLETVNIATGTGTTLIETIALLSAVAGRPVPYIFGPTVMEKRAVVADNAKMRAMTGWRPKIRLKEGLSRALNRSRHSSL